MECCECSQPGGDDCLMEKCERKCHGNYCLIDFDGVEQVSDKFLLKSCHLQVVPDNLSLKNCN